MGWFTSAAIIITLFFSAASLLVSLHNALETQKRLRELEKSVWMIHDKQHAALEHISAEIRDMSKSGDYSEV